MAPDTAFVRPPPALSTLLAVACLLLASCAVFRPSGSREAAALSPDVTAQVEELGNPLQARYPAGPFVYARNLWALCAFRGEVLIGAGNSSNFGPASNAGPVPLVVYSPSTGVFRTAFTVDDEQIDRFRVRDGTVYVPGHDPRESWALGNFYRPEPEGRWRKVRTIPGGIHTYDMALFGGRLFAGLGTTNGAVIAMSSDAGATWTGAPVASSRIYSLFESEGDLFAAGPFPGEAIAAIFRMQGKPLFEGAFQYDGKGGFRPRPDLTADRLFPGIRRRANRDAKIARSVTFQGHAAYLGALCHNDHQYIPFGAFVAMSLKEGQLAIRPVPIPAGARPWDLLGDGDTLYVLWDKPGAAGTTVGVSASRDGVRWQELLRFQSKTFARSLALLDGDFYLGLGCEVADPQAWTVAELPPETGALLRVKRAAWSPPAPSR